MAASVLLACGLNESKLDSYIHISEESGIDGNFLISCILGQRIRVQDTGVILICLHQTYQHYLNAGMRLGYNMNLSKDKNLFIIEPINEIGNNFPNSKWLLNTKNNVNNIDDNEFCKILLNDIQKCIEIILKTKTKYTIIIDNLEFLIDLNIKENDLIKFCKILKSYAEENSSTIFTKLCNSNIHNSLNKKLKCLSHMSIDVIKLKSGNFKEVDGKLTITKSKWMDIYQINKYEKSVLYKINEKNIRTYNPGEIGIKI